MVNPNEPQDDELQDEEYKNLRGVRYPSRAEIAEIRFNKKAKEIAAKQKLASRIAFHGKVDINDPKAFFFFKSVLNSYIEGYERNHDVVLGDDIIEKFWEMNCEGKISACFRFLNLIVKKYRLKAVTLDVWAECKKDLELMRL